MYTCENGLDLFNKGRKFGAWNKNTRSYLDADKNIKLLVEENGIVEIDDGYGVINLKSVEIIE